MSAQTNRRAAKALAREDWDGLSQTMQAEMICAELRGGGGRVLCDSTVKTATALHVRAMVDEPCSFSDLTPWGLLVREAGLAARAEAAR